MSSRVFTSSAITGIHWMILHTSNESPLAPVSVKAPAPSHRCNDEVREVPFTVGRRAHAVDWMLVELSTKIIARSSRNFVSNYLFCSVSC